MEGLMKWVLVSRAAKVAAIALMLASCGAVCGSDAAMQVNRPLAQADVASPADFAHISEIVREFSRKNNFAVQENLTHPRGNLDFDIRLFRDDISVSVNRLAGEPIALAAYPLCVCELGTRIGLQAAANAAVRELQEDLSH
jgi:hypothetical protein